VPGDAGKDHVQVDPLFAREHVRRDLGFEIVETVFDGVARAPEDTPVDIKGEDRARFEDLFIDPANRPELHALVANGSAVTLSLKFGVWAIRKLRNRAGLDAPRLLDLLLAAAGRAQGTAPRACPSRS
jgi:hypothetical protein